MAQEPIYNSTGAGAIMPHGSRIITINIASTNYLYICEQFSVEQPTAVLERSNHLGQPNGFKAIAKAKTGSATLQLNTDTTPIPPRMSEFDGIAQDDVAKWVITNVSKAEAMEALNTVTIQFREKI